MSLRGPRRNKLDAWGPLALVAPSLLARFLGSGPRRKLGSGPRRLSGSGPCHGMYSRKRLPSFGPLRRLALGPLGQIRLEGCVIWSSWVLVPLENLNNFRRNLGLNARSVMDLGGGDVALSLTVIRWVSSLEDPSLVDGADLVTRVRPSVWAGEAWRLRGGTGGVLLTNTPGCMPSEPRSGRLSCGVMAWRNCLALSSLYWLLSRAMLSNVWDTAGNCSCRCDISFCRSALVGGTTWEGLRNSIIGGLAGTTCLMGVLLGKGASRFL